MVCVLAGVLDRDVLKKWTVHSQKVVDPVPQLPTPTDHAPSPPVSLARLALWEEMGAHVLKPCNGEGHCDIFVPKIPFRISQVRNEVVSQQQHRPLGEMPTSLNDDLYGGGVVWGNVTPQDMQLLPPQHQLEADDVGTMELECLGGEVPLLALEDSNLAAV